jgi:hypothetical protein
LSSHSLVVPAGLIIESAITIKKEYSGSPCCHTLEKSSDFIFLTASSIFARREAMVVTISSLLVLLLVLNV